MKPQPAQIKAARKMARLTQTQAAQMVGVTLRNWQYWESGTSKMPQAAWEIFQIKVNHHLSSHGFQAGIS